MISRFGEALMRMCSTLPSMVRVPGRDTYRTFRDRPEVILARELEACEARLGGWFTDSKVSPRLTIDAHLAAFALSGSFRLVTFDGDFERFNGLEWLRLQP